MFFSVTRLFLFLRFRGSCSTGFCLSPRVFAYTVQKSYVCTHKRQKASRHDEAVACYFCRGEEGRVAAPSLFFAQRYREVRLSRETSRHQIFSCVMQRLSIVWDYILVVGVGGTVGVVGGGMGGVLSHRWMPLEGLSHGEQLAVFLNLYHVMLLHAFFILGPPGSPLRYVCTTAVLVSGCRVAACGPQ